jgi:hypothetical protein
MIRLFVALWLITGNAMAVENAKPRGMLGGVPDAPTGAQRMGPKSKDDAAREALIKEILGLPPLSNEDAAKLRAEGEWQGGLRRGETLQKNRGRPLPGLDQPWHK